MKLMKKMVSAAAAMLMASAMIFSAYAAQKTAYQFTYNEKQVTVGQDADDALKLLGKAEDEKTLNNCAAGNGAAKDMAYMYKDFDLTVSTNEKGKEIVWDINFKTDKVQTEEGLKIGDTPAKVKQLYPSAKENYGLYTATLGNTQVIVDCGMKNDKVVGISYQYYEAK